MELAGFEIPGDGGRGRLYLRLHSHLHDSCIPIGSHESHFNALLIVMDKLTRRCPQTITSKEKGEPKRNRTEVLLLTSLTRTARPNRLTWGVGITAWIYYGQPHPHRDTTATVTASSCEVTEIKWRNIRYPPCLPSAVDLALRRNTVSIN